MAACAVPLLVAPPCSPSGTKLSDYMALLPDLICLPILGTPGFQLYCGPLLSSHLPGYLRSGYLFCLIFIPKLCHFQRLLLQPSFHLHSPLSHMKSLPSTTNKSTITFTTLSRDTKTSFVFPKMESDTHRFKSSLISCDFETC